MVAGHNSATGKLMGNLKKYLKCELYGSLWGFSESSQQYNKAWLLRHPLWTDHHPEWLVSQDFLHQANGDRYPLDKIKSLTPFGLLSCPGEYS